MSRGSTRLPNNIEVASRHAEKSGLTIDYRNVTAKRFGHRRAI